ncbi:MAG TPA: hypothetical protein VMV84_03020 [Dehalococcoidales bacterium]|nr:hypothetical protein [Dehalococcoidales bacterium]
MKKIFSVFLTLVLVLSFSLVTAGPALAWEVEDPCVASNEDFIAGGGTDDSTWETQSGAQPWPYPKNPNEGYNLYRDDVTDTGNLDVVFILTFTPDEVDLPIIASYGPYPDEGLAEYWYMGDESPDTYYWALEPRGYNLPDIDIKPGSDPNSINLKSRGVVPVAVLTTDEFNASTVNPETVLFAGASPVRWVMCDVDDDGDLDLLFHFKTQELDLDEDSTEATLTGATDTGQPIEGTDTVNIVPKKKGK